VSDALSPPWFQEFAMAAKAISDAVLREIFEAFAESKKLPSAEAVKQLAAATGKSADKIKDEYTEVYQDTSLSDDNPWSGRKR
jgi:hypothetical protein